MTDHGTIEAAYTAYYPALVRRLTVVVGDPPEAEGLAQATFEGAMGEGGTLGGGDRGARVRVRLSAQ